MPKIRYIGKKRSTKDNVAGTGLEWSQGQVHEVPSTVAGKLLAHKDVWALADSSEMTDKMREDMNKVQNAYTMKRADDVVSEEDGEEDGEDLSESEQLDLDENDALPNITRMNRENLARLSKSRFGETFPDEMPLDEIRERIVSLQNARKRVV